MQPRWALSVELTYPDPEVYNEVGEMIKVGSWKGMEEERTE